MRAEAFWAEHGSWPHDTQWQQPGPMPYQQIQSSYPSDPICMPCGPGMPAMSNLTGANAQQKQAFDAVVESQVQARMGEMQKQMQQQQQGESRKRSAAEALAAQGAMVPYEASQKAQRKGAEGHYDEYLQVLQAQAQRYNNQ